MRDSIEKRQSIEKERLVEQLKKTPVVQIACEKSGVSRATYYRWRKDEEDFAKNADTSLLEGSLLVNDIAESQLMSAIKDKNMTAIIFWLKHHHPNYATKVEVTARFKADEETLTPEQDKLVTKALQLAALIPNVKTEEQKGEEK